MILQVTLVCLTVLYGTSKAQMHPAQIHQPQPYRFGYSIKDHESEQHREEAGDGVGNVKGNYGFIDNKGIRRQVDYIADNGGFRAQIKTNEPGTTGRSPAAVRMISNDPYTQGAGVPYNSRTNVPFVPALLTSNGKYGFPTVTDFHAYIPEAALANQAYGPAYMGGGLAYSNMLGAGYMQQPGIVYYGANMINGVITGMDSRFSQV